MIDTAPGGTPASVNASASFNNAHEVNSGGLTMRALPLASPGPTYSIGMVTGKFHGVIAAHTPTGRRNVNIRLPRSDVGITSPDSRFTSSAALRKYSAASVMSSRDSAWYGLPCSKVWMRAISGMCSSTRSAMRWHNSARSNADQKRSSSAASRAAVTARSMSADEARGTLAMCSPVTGLRSSWTRSPVPSLHSPAMSSLRSSAGMFSPFFMSSFRGNATSGGECLSRRWLA